MNVPPTSRTDRRFGVRRPKAGPAATCLLLVSIAFGGCGGSGADDGDGSGDGSGESSSVGGSATSGSTTGGTTTAVGCDAGPPSDPVPPQVCDNPQPGSQAGGAPSGWILCDGGTRHREMAVACESPGECETDADCETGQICECTGASSSCITAYCTTDGDCLDGYHCWRWNGAVACDGPHDLCRVEPCLVNGTVCEVCEYQPATCAMGCVDYGPCTG